MPEPRLRAICFRGVFVVSLAAALAMPAAAEDPFDLAASLPQDVFLYMAERPNPERAFLSSHWQGVGEALQRSGVKDDVEALLASMLGEPGMAELERLKGRAIELLAGVDWQQLGSSEVGFAERFAGPVEMPGGGVNFGMPDMVWLMRGSAGGAEQSYPGLVAILEGLVEEVNAKAGPETLGLVRGERSGTQWASVDLLSFEDSAPPMPLTVARRGELIVIGLGRRLIDDVLDLAGGAAGAETLARRPAFTTAFEGLPAPEDQMVFFDMQIMLQPIQAVVDRALQEAREPQDVVLNSVSSGEVHELNTEAWAAYDEGDHRRGLELVEQAHELSPSDSRVLYYLACFHALTGDGEQALGFLERAVAGGFWSPGHISHDPDLSSLREDPRYERALELASERATMMGRAQDLVLNSVSEGEVSELNNAAWAAYEEGDYERGLELVEQAHELSPGDSRVLYYLACFHALTGDGEQALDFLERAVAGGFLSPRHIASDPDLSSLRTDPRYAAAVAAAVDGAAEHGTDWPAVARSLSERMMGVPGILDHVAAVSYTEGTSVYTESVASLVPGADEHPFYPVLRRPAHDPDFGRFLPAETESFAVSSGIDLAALQGFVEDSIRRAGPAGERLLADWAEAQEKTGFDLAHDFISWIEGNTVLAVLEHKRGWIFLAEVKDEMLARDKTAAALELLSARLAEAAKSKPGLAMMGLRRAPVVHERLEGFENLFMAMSPKPVLWGVANGRLILGSSPEAILLCLDTARGDHPDIRENARVMAEMIAPEGAFTSVALSDRRQLGDQLAQLLGTLSIGISMASMGVQEEPARQLLSTLSSVLTKLTPVMGTIDFIRSTAGHTSFDGGAWHTRKVIHYQPVKEAAKEISL